jgi:hypothetical protein
MNPLHVLVLVEVLLLATWFAAISLLALWAATSSYHWFIRAIVALCGTALWLAVPAYEPVIVFGFETLLVAIGVWAYRGRQKNLSTQSLSAGGAAHRHSRLKFSLRFTMLMCALVALATFVCTRIPREVWAHSPSLLLAAAILAAVALVAAWIT